MDNVEMSVLKWIGLLRELKHRGRGRRESGAFLLAKLGTRKVCEFICYDDLDPNALSTGVVVLNRVAWARLWKYCSEHKLEVLADIHTHPTDWTGQSSTDMRYPMVSQVGHVAMIAPNYARCWWQGLSGVGIYEYLGNYQWNKWPCSAGEIRLVLL